MRRRVHFDYGLFWALFAGSLCVIALSAMAHEPMPQDFTAKTTAQYLDLCNTQPGESGYVAALHFCEGFATGGYQYYLALATRSPEERVVCLPDPPPPRDRVKANFIRWAQANPASLNDPPVDSLFHFLAQAYPCGAQAEK